MTSGVKCIIFDLSTKNKITMKSYKIHLINVETGESCLYYMTSNEKEARRMFKNLTPKPGYQLDLSVVFNGSTTLIEFK